MCALFSPPVQVCSISRKALKVPALPIELSLSGFSAEPGHLGSLFPMMWQASPGNEAGLHMVSEGALVCLRPPKDDCSHLHHTFTSCLPLREFWIEIMI